MHGKQLTFHSAEATRRIKGRNAELNEAHLGERLGRRPALTRNLFGLKCTLFIFFSRHLCNIPGKIAELLSLSLLSS